MATQVTRAKRVEVPLWLNGRTVLGFALFLIAFAMGQRILAAADNTVTVWAAARDLPRGESVDAADLEAVQVRLPSDTLSEYVTTVDEATGSVLLNPIHAGEFVPLATIARGPDARAGRSITIPISPEHAAGGRLGVGDRVDVLATFNSGDVRARTVAVARSLEVLGTVDAGGVITGEEATVGISVAATPEEAARLAFAIRTGEIDLARVEAPMPPGPLPAVDQRSFR